ncbi:O-antigen ligase family protein [Tenacibaculum insulae]|uniref:O-antigen ligase family protein n=1 Tax=Tenacibaculum insulae TaxID=2029677 RepID=UPI003AB7A5BB
MKKFAVIISLFYSNISVVFLGTPLVVLPTLLLIALVVFNALSEQKNTGFKLPLLMVVFFLLIVIGSLRNNNIGSNFNSIVYQTSKFVFFFIAFIQTLNKSFIQEKSISDIFNWMIYLPLFFCVFINVSLLTLGFEPEVNAVLEGKKNDFVILSGLGIAYNPEWSFIEGFKGSRSIIGLLLLLSLLKLRNKLLNKTFIYLSIITSVIILLILDTRAALFYPIFIFILVVFFFNKEKPPRFLFVLPFLILYGSNLLLLFLAYISQMEEFSFLARSSEDFATGNSRSLIWGISFLEFFNFKPIHIVGYGEFGHYKSGASILWSAIFSGDEGGETKTPHSLFYSVLFDYGYIGLLIILLIQRKIIRVIRYTWSKCFHESVYILSFFIYWVLLGITESFFGFYSSNIIFIFVSFCVFSLGLKFYTDVNLNKF